MFKRIAEKIRSWRALSAYRKRLRKYENLRYPVRRVSQAILIQNEIHAAREVDGDAAVGQDFLDRTVAARDETLAQIARRTGIMVLLGIYLLLQAFSISVELPVQGLQLDKIPGSRELALLVQTILAATILARTLNVLVLNSAIKAAIRATYPQSVWYFYDAAWFPTEVLPLLRPVYDPRLLPMGGKRLFVPFMTATLLAMLLGLIGTYIVTRGIVFFDLWTRPSLPLPWTYFVVVLSAAVDLTSTIYIAFYFFPFKHRDYDLNEAFETWDQINPAVAQKLREEAFGAQIEDEERMRVAGLLKDKKPPSV